MKMFKWQLLIVVLIIFGSLGLAYSTPIESKDSKEGSVSSISTENKELHQKLKEGCEIDAYIKQGDSVCEIKIRIKEDFKVPVGFGSGEIERAIIVEIHEDCTPNNGAECSPKNYRARQNKLCGGDRLAYETYKNESRIPDVLHNYYNFRRVRRVDMDAEIINHGVTYAELFRAAEELMHRDKTKLGKGNIYRTKIVFKEIKPDSILLRTGQKLPY